MLKVFIIIKINCKISLKMNLFDRENGAFFPFTYVFKDDNNLLLEETGVSINSLPVLHVI